MTGQRLSVLLDSTSPTMQIYATEMLSLLSLTIQLVTRNALAGAKYALLHAKL